MEDQNENVRLFSTNDIKNWLSANSDVQLPAVQRGFIWRPSQIEGLWDSLFRGYPIGALMLSKAETSICFWMVSSVQQLYR